MFICFVFFKQKTAYEMRISDWSSDVCSSDLHLCALKKWDDLIYTHISATVPGAQNHFLINPFGFRFDEITASNLVKIDLQGNIIGDQSQRVNVNGFAIHGPVHAARKDAMCVMHLHNEKGAAVGMQHDGLLPLS